MLRWPLRFRILVRIFSRRSTSSLAIGRNDMCPVGVPCVVAGHYSVAQWAALGGGFVSSVGCARVRSGLSGVADGLLMEGQR